MEKEWPPRENMDFFKSLEEKGIKNGLTTDEAGKYANLYIMRQNLDSLSDNEQQELDQLLAKISK
jgi:hypothetical protein